MGASVRPDPLDSAWLAANKVARPRTSLAPAEEAAFQSWYRVRATKAGIDPNPDNPLHKYDYRGAYKAGAEPQVAPEDGRFHWPSSFKDDDHPNRFVRGVDTRALDRNETPDPLDAAWDAVNTPAALATSKPRPTARREDTIRALPETKPVLERLKDVGREMFTHRTGSNPVPIVGALGGMVGAMVETPFRAGAAIGQPIAEALMPEQVALARAQGWVPEHVTKEQAAWLAAQTASLALTGPAGTAAGRALAPAIGSRAAAIVGRTGAAAAGGVPFMPEDPAVGAIIGGTLGAAHSTISGERALARRATPRPGAGAPAADAMPQRLLTGQKAPPKASSVPVEDAVIVPESEAATARTAPALLPRLRTPTAAAAPEAPAAPVAPAPIRSVAPVEPPAEPVAPSVAPTPPGRSSLRGIPNRIVPPQPTDVFVPDDEGAVPEPVRVRARTASGALMSPRKATDEQLAGEFRALTDAQSEDGNFVQGIEDHPAFMTWHETIGSQSNVKGGSMREDARGVLEEAGFEPDVIQKWAFLKKQFENREKTLAKVRAELDRRKIDHGDAYWMGGGDEAPNRVGETRARYGGITPEQRAHFEALQDRLERAAGGPVESVANYYNTPGARVLSHAVKAGDLAAIRQMAAEMAPRIPEGATIVPVPGHGGRATAMLEVAKEIAQLRGGTVADALRGKARQSLYEAKRSGRRLSPAELALTVVGKVPKGAIVIDNVAASGATASAVRKALPGVRFLTHSVDAAEAPAAGSAVGERKRPYMKTAPSLFAPDNPSMFEGPANMDETSVGKRPEVAAEPEAPKVRNAAELTAREDQGKLFERGPSYAADVQTDTPAFKEWFGGSKTIDGDGKPLVLYHGTARNFERFSHDWRGTMGGRLGFWFASDPAATQIFSNPRYTGEASATMPVYLRVEKPMEYAGWDAFVAAGESTGKAVVEDRLTSLRRSLKRKGYDGVVIRGSKTDSGVERDDWVAFEPTQIKSATGNSGAFDPENPSIVKEPVRAYHGTGAAPFDQFSLEHSGEGEGAAAYGYGHYFAGRKEIAQYYRDKLSAGNYPKIEQLREYFKPGRIVAGYSGHDRVVSFNEKNGDWSVRVHEVTKQPDGTWKDVSFDTDRVHHTAPSNAEIDKVLGPQKRGSLYDVGLPDDQTMLDWDKRLSEQPPAVKAIIAADPELSKIAAASPQYTGEELYKILSGWRGDSRFLKELEAKGLGYAEGASRYLAAAGIPGQRYFDASSRLTPVHLENGQWRLKGDKSNKIFDTKGEAEEWVDKNGTRNYVIFDDKLIKITGVEEPKSAFNKDQYDVFNPHQLELSNTPAAIEARQVRVYGSVAKAEQAVALVKQHAGKFATSYHQDAPTPAGRLKKIGGRPVTAAIVDLVGQRLVTPGDVAQALYPFRSPLMERNITILSDDTGRVLSATMDTSGATGYVAFYGGGAGAVTRMAADIAGRAARVGAKRAKIAHNHPSGIVVSSDDDRGFLMALGSELQNRYGITLEGQLIIDHKTATWMFPRRAADGTPYIADEPWDVEPSGVDWTAQGDKVGPKNIGALVGPGAGNGGLHVVYLDNQLRVLALEPHNPSALATIGKWLPARAKGLGSGHVVLVGPTGTMRTMFDAVHAAQMNINVREVVAVTPRPDGRQTVVSAVAAGLISGDYGLKTERTPRAERKAFRRLSEPDASYGPAGGVSGRNAGTLRTPGQVAERTPEYGDSKRRRDEFKKAKAAGIASGLTPEQADAYAAAAKDIDFDGAKAVAQAKLEAGGLRTRLMRWADAAADQTRAIDRISRVAVEKGMPMDKAPEYQLALSYNSDDTIARALYDAPEMATTHGILDPITREPMGPTLESVVKPLGHNPEHVKQAFTYVVALRKVGRGLKATAGDEGELASAIAAVDALGKIPRNRQFATDLETYLNAIGSYAVRSGLWTEETWEQLKHSDVFYVPFKRLMTHIEPPKASKTYGTQRANVGPGIKPFEGSRRYLSNPVEAVAGYVSGIIRRADAARVGSSVIDAITQYLGEEGKAILTPLAANDPAVKAWAAASARRNLRRAGFDIGEAGMLADLSAPMIDPHNPVVWRNRKGGMPQVPRSQLDAFNGEESDNIPEGREFFLLNDPDLYKALMATRADSPLGNGALMTALRLGRRIMTVTATGINPRFALGLNIARDVPQAMMQVPGITPLDVAKGITEAVKAVVGQSDFADLMGRHGLGSASIYAHAINAEAVARRLAPVSQLQRLRTVGRSMVMRPLEALERIGAASDLVARLAAAKAVQRGALKKGATARAAAAIGSTTAIRSTVNFNRRSGLPAMQVLEQTVPFFGAAMRSTLRAAEASQEVPFRVAGAATILALAVLAEWAYSRRDEEERAKFVDRPSTERPRFLQFGPVRYPLNQEMALVAAAMRVGLGQLSKDDPDAAAQLIQSVYNLLPPVASDWAQMDIIAPWPGLRQLQEVARGKSTYGNRPIVPERLQDLPPAMRRQDSTSPTWDVLASGVRKSALIIPGGDALAETSPLEVEYVIRGFFNNMTPLLAMVGDAGLNLSGASRSLPVAVPAPGLTHPLSPTSAFIVREPPSRTMTEGWFYDHSRQFTEGQNALRAMDQADKLADTPAGERRANGMRARVNAGDWTMDGPHADEIFGIFKEAHKVLKDYRASELDVREAVNNGVLQKKDARRLLDSLTTERQHMLRTTRTALEQLGVPARTRP